MFRYWTKQTNKQKRLFTAWWTVEIERKGFKRITKCPLKVKSKTTETGPFRVVVSLHPPGGNNFVLSRNSTATLQQMCPWLLERLPVNHSELFESLNFESVQDVKAKFSHSPIHHYASIYGALLFSVSPVRCTCIIKYGAVRKFFQCKNWIERKGSNWSNLISSIKCSTAEVPGWS